MFLVDGCDLICDRCGMGAGLEDDLRYNEMFSEVDYPSPCAHCGTFLNENLTGEGERIAAAMLGDAIRHARKGEPPEDGVKREFVLSLAKAMQYSGRYSLLGRFAEAEVMKAIQFSHRKFSGNNRKKEKRLGLFFELGKGR